MATCISFQVATEARLDARLGGLVYLFTTSVPNALNARELLNRHIDEIHPVQHERTCAYGRAVVPFAHRAVTEISCHCRGAQWFVPGEPMIVGALGAALFALDRAKKQGTERHDAGTQELSQTRSGYGDHRTGGASDCRSRGCGPLGSRTGKTEIE